MLEEKHLTFQQKSLHAETVVDVDPVHTIDNDYAEHMDSNAAYMDSVAEHMDLDKIADEVLD